MKTMIPESVLISREFDITILVINSTLVKGEKDIDMALEQIEFKIVNIDLIKELNNNVN